MLDAIITFIMDYKDVIDIIIQTAHFIFDVIRSDKNRK